MAPIMRGTTAAVRVEEGGKAVLWLRCHGKQKDCGVKTAFARNAWLERLTFQINYFETPSLVTQGTDIGRPASTAEFAVVVDKVMKNVEGVTISVDDNRDGSLMGLSI